MLRKHEVLTRSLRKMERTLDTVLRSIGNPGIASGMVSRSPSPSAAQVVTTQALLASPSPPASSAAYEPSSQHPPGSPILHSLPDNSLNPLGLLAEASLANRRAQAAAQEHGGALATRPQDSTEPQLGVASDNYFKPGKSPQFLCLILMPYHALRPNQYIAVTAIVHRTPSPARNVKFREHGRGRCIV
jgi:hypothetical protein